MRCVMEGSCSQGSVSFGSFCVTRTHWSSLVVLSHLDTLKNGRQHMGGLELFSPTTMRYMMSEQLYMCM